MAGTSPAMTGVLLGDSLGDLLVFPVDDMLPEEWIVWEGAFDRR